jgi:hypothetical protein
MLDRDNAIGNLLPKETEQPLVERGMKHHSLTFILALTFLSAVQVACGSQIPSSETPTATVSIIGQLRAWTSNTPIAGRHLALCRSQGDPRDGLCELLTHTALTDRQGRFQFYDVPSGTYFLLYDSGLSDFDEAMAKWGGETLHFGDQEWLSDFLGVDLSQDNIEYRMPEGLPFTPGVNWLSSYCMLTLLVGQSPFIIAHDLESVSQQRELHCDLISVLPGQTARVDVQVLYFQ